jgi:hypothetical protein
MKNLFYTSFRFLVSNGRELVVPVEFLVAGIVFQNLVSVFPWSVERFYTRIIYQYVLGALSLVSRSLSFSVGELLTGLIILMALACTVIFCVGLARRIGERRRWVMAWVRCGAWVAAGTLWLFLFAFGLNYQRPLLFELLGYEQRKAEPAELEALGRILVENINLSYTEAHAGDRTPPQSGEIIKLLHEAFDKAPEFRLFPRGEFALPKPAYSSDVLTRLGISGIYFPFTAEPNYNADIPDFQLPFSIAHEMAHQRGIARESEANFVAYVICVNSGDPFVRYSGFRNGLGVLSELYRVSRRRRGNWPNNSEPVTGRTRAVPHSSGLRRRGLPAL